MLLKNNEQDIELSKNVGSLFIASWHKEKTQWLNATNEDDHKYIQALAHKLKGSIRYFANPEVIQTIKDISQQAHEKNSQNVKVSANRLYKQLDMLADEMNSWLLSDPH